MTETVLGAHLTGTVVALSKVADEAFASGALGLGIAIEPTEGKLCAPADGTIDMVFDTRHAVGMTTAAGMELLLHIGIDTVKLGGKHFTAHVQPGQAVKKGELLALENGKLSFTDKDLTHAVVKLTRNMVNKNSGFVTVISGEDVTTEDAEAVCEALRAKLGSSVEVTHVEGGQPVYYYMISVE
jgi:glucose-specific phosphotransferase system IIA component